MQSLNLYREPVQIQTAHRHRPTDALEAHEAVTKADPVVDTVVAVVEVRIVTSVVARTTSLVTARLSLRNAMLAASWVTFHATVNLLMALHRLLQARPAIVVASQATSAAIVLKALTSMGQHRRRSMATLPAQPLLRKLMLILQHQLLLLHSRLDRVA